MQVQITKDYWDAHPEIQAEYKVGDAIEVAETESQPTPNAGPVVGSKTSSGSTMLDNLGKEFEGKISATTKDIELPSGDIATISEFKGKHVFKAQRYMAQSKDDKGSDGSEMMPIIMSICTLINGKGITPEDLDEMPGEDVLVLMGEFSAANFSKS